MHQNAEISLLLPKPMFRLFTSAKLVFVGLGRTQTTHLVLLVHVAFTSALFFLLICNSFLACPKDKQQNEGGNGHTHASPAWICSRDRDRPKFFEEILICLPICFH